MLEQHKNTQRDIVFPAETVNTCLINEKTNMRLKYCASDGLRVIYSDYTNPSSINN